jgi:peptidoglycan/LPS O-acetylase OafA/YrhL
VRLILLLATNMVLGVTVARSPFGTPLLFEEDFGILRHVLVPALIGMAVGALEARVIDPLTALLSSVLAVAVCVVAVVAIAEVVTYWFTFAVVFAAAGGAAMVMLARSISAHHLDARHDV